MTLPTGHPFILSAFDRDQWCPVLEARFLVEDLEELRAILGDAASGDSDLSMQYTLEEGDLAMIVERFGVAFDVGPLACGETDIHLCRQHGLSATPYLVHTGYELPLLLDGRKKLARMTHEYPPERFDGEDRFDHWVDAGVLYRVEIREPMSEPIGDVLGLRTVYYAPPGEEWRVPAMELILKQPGEWNETLERLEGKLLGYSDAENDWWIEASRKNGGVGGIALCCAIDTAGLAWIEASGFKALPPVGRPTLRLRSYSREMEQEVWTIFREEENAACVVRFNIAAKHVMKLMDLRHAGPWDVSSTSLGDLNRHVRGSLVLVARRGDAGNILP